MFTPINFLSVQTELHPPIELTADKHMYAHGGGFGLAIEVLAHPFWSEILKSLEPKLYHACDQEINACHRLLDARSAGKMILLAENSPVVAAYARTMTDDTFTAELDVWIDPKNPTAIDKAKVIHGNQAAGKISKDPDVGQKVFDHNIDGSNLADAHTVTTWFEIYQQALASSSTNKSPYSLPVCLDIKSCWSNAANVAGFAEAFQKTTGQKVKYVGSFDKSQLTELQNSITPLRFFHAVWDFEGAVLEENFSGHALFNGADLLGESNEEYKVNQGTLDTLKSILRDRDIHLGVYVQEPDAGTQAIQSLIRLVVDQEPDIFQGGFALGSRRDGIAPAMIRGSGAGIQKSLMTRHRTVARNPS